MWGFVDCTRFYMTGGRPTVILSDASLRVDTYERVALLVRPGQGKTTIVRMLAGLERPNWGTVMRDAGGWPLGYSGGFQGEVSGEVNIRNLAELADVDPLDLAAFCYDFSELGDLYFQPVRLYSPTAKARLGMAASLGIPARTYLADDRIAIGDEAFRAKIVAALTERQDRCGLIYVGSNPRQAKDICDRFYVVDGGTILACDDLEEATTLLTSAIEDDGSDADVPVFDLA